MDPPPQPAKPSGLGLINAASLLAKLADSADEEKDASSLSSQSQGFDKANDGSLKCPQCTRTFPKLVALKSHIIMHSDIRKHGCEVCGKKFARRHDLLRHLRTVHATTRISKEEQWQTHYRNTDKRPRLDPLDIYTTETPLSASSELYSYQQEMTPTSAGLYEDYRRKSSAATEPLTHRPSLTEKVLSHRISAPSPSTFIPPECIHGLGIGYCRVCPQVDIGKVPFDKSFKCVHGKLPHFCRSCRNEGYWRKLEEEKRRRSMANANRGEMRVIEPRLVDQRVMMEQQRMMMDQRLMEQRSMMERGLVDHRIMADPRMDRGMGGQRMMMDSPRHVENRNLIDQRLMVDQRGVMDPRMIVDQRVVDQRGVVDQTGLIDQRGMVDQRGIIDHRGMVDQRNIIDQRGMVDQRGFIDQRGSIDQRVLMDQRGSIGQRSPVEYGVDQRKIMDQRAILEHRGIIEQKMDADKRTIIDQRNIIDQANDGLGLKRDANGNVKF